MSVRRSIILKIPKTDIESCVYRIWFGDFYYIGTTRSLRKRMGEHERYLTKELAVFNPRGTYCKIIMHLKKNGHILEGVVEVLASCQPELLCQAEREFHLIAFSDDRCLNVFYHHRTRIKALSVPLPRAE